MRTLLCPLIGADFNIYTNGSESKGLLNGGVGVVVTKGNLTSPGGRKDHTVERCRFACECLLS